MQKLHFLTLKGKRKLVQEIGRPRYQEKINPREQVLVELSGGFEKTKVCLMGVSFMRSMVPTTP